MISLHSATLAHPLFVASALFAFSTLAFTAEMEPPADQHHDHHTHVISQTTPAKADPHAMHRQTMDQIGYSRSLAHYALPKMELTTTQGTSIALEQLLDTDQPLAVNFIFTSCTTICPIMSATFSQAQKKLGDEAAKIRWVSITIDPEHDTPQRLREYAQHFDAGSHWSFLTGTNDNIVTLQKVFDVYRGDKMNHIPVTLLRAGRDTPWVRLNGLTSSAELVNEYRQLTAHH